jgi:LacI family repressor for deo operon, udp, cdd, tsx, nupC, and nupG
MNIKDVAKLAGTSPSTVSRVINNDARVSPEIREKVLQVIQKTKYKPNAIGRSLRGRSSKKLLMVLPTIENPFYSDIVTGFEEHARKNGFSVLFAVTNRKVEIERLYYDVLFTRQVDGVATFIPTITASEINKISHEYPFVACCWRGYAEIDVSYVCIDNERAVMDMMRHLIGLGHTRIAALNGDYPERTYERERERGYWRALEEAGLPCRREYYIACEYGFRAGYAATGQLMAMPEPPTAIFALADDRAAGIIKFLNENGYRPGADVDVSGFDDLQVSEITTPAITTVSQPRYELGKESAHLLLSRVEDNAQPNRGVILSHKLVLRGSTREEVARPAAPAPSVQEKGE